MSMQDTDWLDRRLAQDAYTPDDGFTARVVAQLPRAQHSAAVRRRAILVSAGLLAFCLFLVQLPSLGATVSQFLAQISVVHLTREMAGVLQQRTTLCTGAGLVVLLSVGAIPFLRRWA